MAVDVAVKWVVARAFGVEFFLVQRLVGDDGGAAMPVPEFAAGLDVFAGRIAEAGYQQPVRTQFFEPQAGAVIDDVLADGQRDVADRRA